MAERNLPARTSRENSVDQVRVGFGPQSSYVNSFVVVWSKKDSQSWCDSCSEIVGHGTCSLRPCVPLPASNSLTRDFVVDLPRPLSEDSLTRG